MATCKAWSKPGAPPPSPPAANEPGSSLLRHEQNEEEKALKRPKSHSHREFSPTLHLQFPHVPPWSRQTSRSHTALTRLPSSFLRQPAKTTCRSGFAQVLKCS